MSQVFPMRYLGDGLPADWVDELRVEYNDRKHELNKVLA
jgi:hypothetical protein